MPSFPRLHEILGLPAPAERMDITGIVMLDATLCRRDALAGRIEDGMLESLPREPGEEPVGGVHP